MVFGDDYDIARCVLTLVEAGCVTAEVLLADGGLDLT